MRDVIREADRSRKAKASGRKYLPPDHLFVPCTVCGNPTPVHYMDSCEWVGCSDECITTLEETHIADRIDEREYFEER